MNLQANIVTVDEDGPVINIGFADHPFETKEYVLLSYDLDARPTTFDLGNTPFNAGSTGQ